MRYEDQLPTRIQTGPFADRPIAEIHPGYYDTSANIPEYEPECPDQQAHSPGKAYPKGGCCETETDKGRKCRTESEKRKKLETPAITHDGSVVCEPGEKQTEYGQNIKTVQRVAGFVFHIATSWVYFTIEGRKCN